METSRVRMNAGILLLYLTLATISLTHCDAADRSMRLWKGPRNSRNIINKNLKKLKTIKHLDLDPSTFSSNVQPYSVSSPYSSPPYGSLASISLIENSPPYCVNPPPGTPTTTPTPTATGFQPTLPSPPYYYSSPVLPTPSIITPGPPGFLPPPTPDITPSPPSDTPGSPEPILNPPIIFPGPPGSSMSPPGFLPPPTPDIIPSPPSDTPGSPEPILNPPIIFPGPPGSSMSPPYYEPAPPSFEPAPPFIPSPTDGTTFSPPTSVPSPAGGGSTPSPPSVFEPPVVYPPPSGPPAPNTAPQATLWCVAKSAVPDPIIQEAMNYACWSGADCTSIQPNGPCYEPDTVIAHASYAFNSYWQRNKAAGGTCSFGGTAILVSVDPSYDGCRFIYN